MTQTRIRWNDDEKSLVAAEILRLRTETPNLSMVVAARTGQSVLPPARQREIKAWSQLEPTMQPVLDELTRQKPPAGTPATAPAKPLATTLADAGASADAATSPKGTGAPAPITSAAESLPTSSPSAPPANAAPDVANPPARAASALPASPLPILDLLKTESVLLAAFQSPVVELALVDLFSRAMSGALKRLTPETPAAAQPTPFRGSSRGPELVRILVAGFAGPELKKLADSLDGTYEVRSWTPVQGPQLFETLANICSVAVIPQEFGDDIESALDKFKLQVLRHEGSPARLQERLDELLNA